MNREEAELRLIRKPCPKCKSTRWMDYSVTLISIVNKKKQFSSSLTCRKCHVPCGAIIWEEG